MPTPAPKSAAAGLSVLPVAPLVMTGTTSVAAMMASSCWMAKRIVWPNFGRSLTPKIMFMIVSPVLYFWFC